MVHPYVSRRNTGIIMNEVWNVRVYSCITKNHIGGCQMPRDTKTYDIVLSCPTDVEAEKSVIESVINDFNKTIGTNLGINLNLKHWSTDSYAQSGGTAQDLLNKQFIYDSDMIICIFWGRMGTPTKRYESGTAEELQEAINAGKQAFLYFSNAPIPPKDLDIEQFKRVREFEKKIQEMNTVYYKQYNNFEEFKNIITTDLNLYFIQSLRSEKNKQALVLKRKSDIVVSGVCNKKISDYIFEDKLDLVFSQAVEVKKKKAIALIEEIKKIYIQPKSDEQKNSTSSNSLSVLSSIYGKKSYEYPDYYVSTINDFAKAQCIYLGGNFFEVGSLSTEKNLYSAATILSAGSSVSFKGSEKEKEKQALVKKLYFEICEYLEWIDYSKQFTDIYFIRLALSNCGTIFESDISVNLKFLKSNYVHFEDTKAPQVNIIELINKNSFVENFFGDVNSIEINSYDYPIYSLPSPSIKIPSLPGMIYQENYENLVEEYFDQYKTFQCYEEFEDEEYIIQKYHFKELKQYTNISFPVPLLFKDAGNDLEIAFEIISKENPEKKVGVITNKEY